MQIEDVTREFVGNHRDSDVRWYRLDARVVRVDVDDWLAAEDRWGGECSTNEQLLAHILYDKWQQPPEPPYSGGMTMLGFGGWSAPAAGLYSVHYGTPGTSGFIDTDLMPRFPNDPRERTVTVIDWDRFPTPIEQTRVEEPAPAAEYTERSWSGWRYELWKQRVLDRLREITALSLTQADDDPDHT